MIANGMIRNAWYVAGFSNEFESGQLKGSKIVGKPFVMWRSESGGVVAFDGRCVHKRMELAAGRFIEKDVLECPYHGFCYDASGRCIRIPSMPESSIPKRLRLKQYPVEEQNGVVWIWPGDLDKASSCRPPKTPEIGADEWSSISSEPMTIHANYRLLIENLLDITHFYPLHEGNVGDLEHSKIPVEFVEDKVDGNHSVMTVRETQNYKQPPYFAQWFGYEVVDRYHTHCMMNPGITRVQMRVAPPGQLGTDAERGFVLYHTHTPIDERSHIWRWCINCRSEHKAGHDSSKLLVEGMAENFPDVVEQDRWALEKQQAMFEFPDEDYIEMHVKTDKAVVMVRKALEQLESKDRAEAA